MEKSPTLLLIEDTEEDVFFFRRALAAVSERVGIRVVDNAWEARKYLQGTAPYGDRNYYPMPDVIVTDMHLPGTSGLELLQWIRNETVLKEIPIVVLSGSMRALELEGVRDLAIEHCVKSPSFAECKEVVRKILSHIRAS